MPSIDISFRVTHNTLEVEREFSATSDRLARATRDSALDAMELLERKVAWEIEDIAGGVYWDIISKVTPIPGGAEGYVITPPSKPHTIEPHGNYPLRFRGSDGGWVSTHHVDHPGSNPVDWVSPLERRQHDDIGHIFFDGWKDAMSSRSTLSRSALPVGGL